MRVQLQLRVAPAPGFRNPRFLLQDQRVDIQFAKGIGGTESGEPGADDNDVMQFIRWIGFHCLLPWLLQSAGAAACALNGACAEISLDRLWTETVHLCQLARMNASLGSQKIHFAILALPETTPTAMYGMFEILSSVGVVWPQTLGQSPGAPRFAVEIVSDEAEPFTTNSGVPVRPTRSIRADIRYDVVIVTDQEISPDWDPRGAWAEYGQWLRRQHRGGATICSVCTGAVLLASGGMLDGAEATTHWSVVGLMEKYFPQINLRPDRILQPAGPEHRIITAGGMSAWQDLLLYLVARFAGEEEARHTAKIYLLGDRSEGQLPFAAMMPPRQHTDAIVRKCQEWVAAHYDHQSPVNAMIGISGLPQRSFKRRFKAATGYAPIDYVQSLRVEEAKQMLETTGEPTDAIAHVVGYEDPTFFRRLFKRRTGTTPARYRRRYQSVGQAEAARADD